MSDVEFIHDAVSRVLADTVTLASIQEAEKRKVPIQLFDALADTGISLMLAPEEYGGVNANLSAALSVLRAAGAAAAPGPVLETILAQRLLTQAGLGPTGGLSTLLFAQPLDGPAPGATFWAAPPPFHEVPWGGLAKHFLVVWDSGTGVRLVVSDCSAWRAVPGADEAGEPRDTLQGENIPVTCSLLSGASYDELLRTAALLRAGQLLGAIEWTFNCSVSYAMERKQFGREIGKFQAVQHMLAELADHTLASAAITMAAAERCTDTMVAAARSRVADAADAAISIGHQVHGAIGFSREYALNYRTRRLMAWRNDYGSVFYWRHRLGAQFQNLSRDAFWPAVADAGLSSLPIR